jgi:hypothetical protein
MRYGLMLEPRSVDPCTEMTHEETEMLAYGLSHVADPHAFGGIRMVRRDSTVLAKPPPTIIVDV